MPLPRSDAEVLVLHNPRCSKSRAALVLLDQNGIAHRERRYLDQPLSRAELGDLTKRLGRSPHEWVRKGERAFREAGLDASSSDAELLDAMARHPILVERPIVVRGKRAIVGRPPEAVLELFED